MRAGGPLLVGPSALAAGEPAGTLVLPVAARGARAFTSVPAGTSVVAAFRDGAPAAILRSVGAGRVLAFASETMAPSAAARPADLARFAGTVHRWAGGTTGHPAWTYVIPGDPEPARPPWPGAAAPPG